MPTTVSVDVYARDRASQTFDKVGRAAHSSGGLVGKFGTTVAGVFTGAALYNGARDLVHVLGDLGESAAQDEAAARRMALQFKNSAGATKGQVAATEDWITAQGKALGISDDELRPALTRAITATHNVADAQKQVALAMDVSASKGKSLSTVEEALAKGAQGNTAGLSRLGVQIKDADGKTKSLHAITQDLAKTYSGQAAAAADTTAGRYARLKVQISETGEAIGYKLLPYAVDFGEWALNKGLPALQDFGGYLQDELGPTVNDMRHWFIENQDELKDFAKVVGQDVVGGLKTVVTVGGEVVHLFDGLPGPVKKVGVEVAIAAFAFHQFNNAMLPVGRGVTNFINNMGTAESRGRAFGSMIRQLTGAAGLVAMTDGLQKANSKLGYMETVAGGAATGFAVGGPWGAAAGTIGAVGLEVYQAAKNTDKASQSVRHARDSYADLLDTLNQVTGAYTKETRAGVLDAAQKSGILATTSRLGIANRDLIGAVLGNEGATKRLNRAYRENASVLDGSEQADFSTWLLNNTHALQGQQDQVRNNARDTKTWGQALKGLPPEVASKVKAIGTDITEEQLKRLKQRYDLTPKQVETIIKAVGTEESIRRIHGVWTIIEDGKKVRTDLNPWQQNLMTGLNSAVDTSRVTMTHLRRTMQDEPAKARVDLGIFSSDLNSQLFREGGQAHTAAASVGRNIKSGVMSGLTGLGGEVFGAVQQAIQNGINAAHAHGGGGGGGGGGKGGGSTTTPRTTNRGGPVSGNYFGLGQNTLASSGAALLGSLVAGLTSGKKPLDRVLDAIRNDVQTKLDFRDALVSAKASFAASFADWQTSIFATAGVDDQPVTLDQILAASGAQLAKSQSVNADVQKLIAMGLSDDLIKQMQANGAQGEDAIHALTTASVQQIAQLNQENAATQANLTAAGTAAASKVFDGQIAVANQVLVLAQETAAAVQALQQWGENLRLTLQGDELVAALAKEKKDKGKQ